MFSWFPCLFKSNSPFESHGEKNRKCYENDTSGVCKMSMYEMMDKFGACELNILMIAGKKKRETVTRWIKSISALYDNGYHFYPGTRNLHTEQDVSKIEKIDYERSALDNVILSQKATLDQYDTPPTLLVFDRCMSTNDPSYRKVITDNKGLRFTTLTVVSDTREIDQRLVNKMDILIFCKDRNKDKMSSRWRSVWEKRFSSKVSFEKFHCCLTTSVGSMKAGVITNEGIHMLKFSRNGSTITNICAFE